MRKMWITALFVAGAVLISAEVSPSWRDINKTARAAIQNKDWAAATAALEKLIPAMNDYSRLLPQFASAAAFNGQTDKALRALELYSRMGLVNTADPLSQSGWSEKQRAEYQRIRQRFDQNAKPVGTPVVAFTLSDAELMPEDIAYDAKTKTFFLSSTRERKVVAVGPDGGAKDFIKTGQDGLWAAMGLGVDESRRTLWVSSGATPEVTGYPEADAGKTALFEYDLDTHALRNRYDLPPLKDQQQLLGDVAVMANGDVLAGDAYGMIYRVHPGTPAPEAMTPRDVFVSVQEPAALPDGRNALVIDYVLGIGKLNLATKAVTWLPHPDNVALNGIDGIVVTGHRAIAVQNGTNPIRISAIDFDDSFSRILGVTVLEQKTPHLTEPTHGVVVGDTYYFIANSEDSKVDKGGVVKKGEVLEAPVIQKLPLAKLKQHWF